MGPIGAMSRTGPRQENKWPFRPFSAQKNRASCMPGAPVSTTGSQWSPMAKSLAGHTRTAAPSQRRSFDWGATGIDPQVSGSQQVRNTQFARAETLTASGQEGTALGSRLWRQMEAACTETIDAWTGESVPVDHIEISWLTDDPAMRWISHVGGEPVVGCRARTARPLAYTPMAAAMIEGSAISSVPDSMDSAPTGPHAATHAGLFGSALSAPVCVDGATIGAIELYARAENAFSEAHARALSRSADYVSQHIAVTPGAGRRALSATREIARRLVAERGELLSTGGMLGSLLSSVTHELRTPLTSIVAFTHILKHNPRGNLTRRQIDYLRTMERNGRRLALLMNDLADLSRIERGVFSIDTKPFRFKGLCREVAAGLIPMLRERGQTLLLDLQESQMQVIGDRDRLAQVLNNLITNASKYSPEDSPIDLKVRVEEQHLSMSVNDRGIGIAEEDKPRLFTSFFRGSNANDCRTDGFGLGLHIARTIVELHGGTIWFESALNVGTSFFVRIPIDEEARSGGGRARAEAAGTGRKAPAHV